ncbi:hypothetical protein GDO86_006712 [Hymenochirus boettgeri]|uniref:Olfactory receptor n=1 Tax=Hymenochirus boettgeri TaxID=247094 RepID=A0A8T2JEQ7_9PIPI|nr:hypothetical protein GDO86_006712 [Hymenochirus boettgeri]
MKNQSSTPFLHIVAFVANREKERLLSIVFIIIYLFGVLINSVILTAIYKDVKLHTNMYIFLCNLSLVDICYLTVTLPKLIYILLSGDNSITFIQCFTQMYFYLAFGGVETLLLSTMAYDRFVAICKPLVYYLMMNRRVCTLITAGVWILAFGNAIFFTGLASNLPFCHSNKINQLFCDVKALADISCDVIMFYKIIYVEAFLFGTVPVSLTVVSYARIISSILHIRCKRGRNKAFSTCSSHFTVLIVFYGTALLMYMRPPTHSENLDTVFSLFFIVVTPMLNPLIYTLRNKDVKKSLIRTMRL